MIHENSQPTRRLPAWVAGLAVLFLLAGSAWALYKLVFQDKPSVAVERVPVSPPGRGWAGGGFNGRGGPNMGGGPGRMDGPNSASSVSRNLSGRIRARHGAVFVFGIPRQKGGGFDSLLEYDDARSWVTSVQWDTQMLAGRPPQYQALADKIGLTAEQKQKLAALTYQPTLSDVEKKDFDRLFTNWVKAPDTEKNAAAEEIYRAVEAAANKHLAESKAALLRRCNEVLVILSEQQMQQIREWFGSPNPQAISPRPGRNGPQGQRLGGGGMRAAATTQPARPATRPIQTKPIQ